MVGEIYPRYGARVYVGETGDVCIEQHREGDHEQVVILHPDEARDLIGLIQKAIAEAKSSS
ncbi:hypothetical protein D3C72_2410010 [compost metagenome]